MNTPNNKMFALQLTVNNHPGVMSHICGLFARRAFNLEGILVTPIDEGATCSVWLLVNNDARIEQMIKQVSKLHDVLEVSMMTINDSCFATLATSMEGLRVSASV